MMMYIEAVKEAIIIMKKEVYPVIILNLPSSSYQRM